jgi:arylsulfatase A-like enzyme
MLARAGWYTFAITGGGALSESWGLARGFQSFHAGGQEFARTVEQALEYVRHRDPRGPWFGFLHTYDVHCPYDPPAPYAGRFTSADAEPIEVAGRCGNPHFNQLELTPGQVRFLSDRYDDDVRRTDDALGALFAALEQLGLFEHTVVIVTSDHGEEFGEHGRVGHERTLYREALHVPLLVAAPGLEPRVVDEPVGLADVVPTVLELLGVEHQGSFDGRSLAPLLRGSVDPARPAGRLADLAWRQELASWIEGDEHWIVDLETRSVQRFDWKTDPDERADLASGSQPGLPERALELRRELERGAHAPLELELAEIYHQLEALGY